VLAAIGKLETDHGRSALPGVHTGHNSGVFPILLTPI
jgi:hypothetical protein